MAYLLDTNIIIAAIKGVPDVIGRLEKIPLSALILSPIVLGELEFGAEKSAQVEKNRARLASLIENIPVASLDSEASRHYGLIRADLEKKGTPIGANDLWIAAQALALGVVLVTDNVGEFSRVAGLEVENWVGKR
ncbi:MAG: type II toxin-antitoxin system VapC family toxin [Betaproteobacteria bacterium]|nr:type II toxin-antitoxin system VapC family toxin [Betaproteobacteria bacterium]